MAIVPETSTTLLRDLASGTDNPRWGEFVSRYRPAMEAFLRSRFPSLESDDIIQETLIAFATILPRYRYVPGETGHFHNYLTGILKHKATDILRRKKRLGHLVRDYSMMAGDKETISSGEEEKWLRTLYEIALQQLMADPRISGRSKEVFSRIAIRGEKPEEVARSLAMSRNSVDQVKWRMMKKLRLLIEDLKRVADRP